MLPSGTELQLSGVILGQLRVTDEDQVDFGATGRDQIQETIELTIPTQQGEERYLPQTDSKFSLSRYPGTPFTMLEIMGESEVFAKVRCSRKHITRIQGGGVKGN